MPRRGGGGFKSSGFKSSGFKSHTSKSPSHGPNVPVYQHPNVPMQAGKPSMLSGVGNAMAQGVGFGAGSEMAHQAVRAMTGNKAEGSQMAHNGP